MSKKMRGQNFTPNEKAILIELVNKHKYVVENKKTDAASSALKREGWQELTDEFNSISTSYYRNTEQLKTCWENIKRFARKYKSKQRTQISGGRTNIPSPLEFQSQVEMILGRSVEGFDHSFDSNEPFADHRSTDFSITIKGETQGEIIDECELIDDEVSELIDDEISELADEHIMPPEKVEKQNYISSAPSRITASKPKESTTLSVDPPSPERIVDDTLVINRKRLDTSAKWVRKKRPKTSLQDKIMQSKLELIEIMKENAKTEGKIKEEQLEQEKIKTEILQRELERSKASST